MKHALDLEFREDSVENICIGDRADELACHEGRQGRIESRDIERDDPRARRRQTRDQAVANLALRPCDENNGCAHRLSDSGKLPPPSTTSDWSDGAQRVRRLDPCMG